MSNACSIVIPVGQNKRYGAANVDKWLDGWALREEPILLTPAELDLPNSRPTDFPVPRRVWVWIRYPSQAVRVQAHAISYSRSAVKIRFLEPVVQTEREGWVWTNAVTLDRTET